MFQETQKEGSYISIKGSIHQEDKTNIYITRTLNKYDSGVIEEIDSSIVIVGIVLKPYLQ